MTSAPRKHDPVAAARANYVARGWHSEEGDACVLGRFAIDVTKFSLPGLEPKLVRRIVLHAMPVNKQSLPEPEVSVTPMKPHNRADLIARFPGAWELFITANPDAPVPGDLPPPPKTAEQQFGPMPNTRTNIPWPGFTDDITFGLLIDLNLNYLEILAYASEAQVSHIGPHGADLRQKARDLLGLVPLETAA
jgi:hypothetical protein